MVLYLPFGLAPVGWAVELSQSQIRQLKQAVVFCRYDGIGGTGFLVNRQGRKGTVLSSVSSLIASSERPNMLQVVFDSGQDTQRVLEGKLKGLSFIRNLAVIEVEGDNLPSPLNLSADLDVFPTMSVFVASFPFGNQMDVRDKNPLHAFSGGSITSLRKSAGGTIEMLQTDIQMVLGSFGAPLVDEQLNVVGVCNDSFVGTRIGLALASLEVRDALNGSHSSLLLEKIGGRSTKGQDIELLGLVFDPSSQLTHVDIELIDDAKVTPAMKQAATQGQRVAGFDRVEHIELGPGSQYKLRRQIGPAYADLKDLSFQVVGKRGGRSIFITPLISAYKIEYREREFEPRERVSPELYRPESSEEGQGLTATLWSLDPAREEMLLREPIRSNVLSPHTLLSDAVATDFGEAKRLFIPSSASTSVIAWSEDGDFLYADVGQGRILLVDYPNAEHCRELQFAEGCKLVGTMQGGYVVHDPVREAIGWTQPSDSNLSSVVGASSESTFQIAKWGGDQRVLIASPPKAIRKLEVWSPDQGGLQAPILLANRFESAFDQAVLCGSHQIMARRAGEGFLLTPRATLRATLEDLFEWPTTGLSSAISSKLLGFPESNLLALLNSASPASLRTQQFTGELFLFNSDKLSSHSRRFLFRDIATTVAVDPWHKCCWAGGTRSDIWKFATNGQPPVSIALPGVPGFVRQITVHPQGKALAIAKSDGLFLVDLKPSSDAK